MHTHTPFVLAVEPDMRQASVLKRVIRDRVHAELLVVDSRDAAIAATSARIPDVILLTALLSPRDEQELISHLRGLAGAEHVQTHTIPQLASSSHDSDGGQEQGGLFGKLRRKKNSDPIPGCDPNAFADEVGTFIAHAAEKKANAPLQPRPFIEEPRRDPMRSQAQEDPTAHAADGSSDQPDADAGSAWASPFEWRRPDPAAQKRKDAPTRKPLVTNAPLAVVAEEEEARRAEAERRAREQAERERERLEAEAAATRERERLDAERRAKEDAERRAKEDAERRAKEEAARRAKAEAERRAKEEAERRAKEEAARRAKEEAERRAKEEAARRAKEEAERRAKEEAARRAKEEAERRAKEEAARRAKEEAERRAKEEAARRAKEEAERRAKEEAARRAKEEAERRAKEEAARRAKEEAERRAKEEAARRAKEEAERRAKEEAARRERERIEAEAAAERERLRLEAEAAEQERLRREAEELARRAAEEREPDEEIEIDLDHDPFADFRDEQGEGALLNLMPITAWARTGDGKRQKGADSKGTDDFDDLIAGLSIPSHVAAIAYARGCRIRRVRVPAPRPAPRSRLSRPVILSKRALEEARNDQ